MPAFADRSQSGDALPPVSVAWRAPFTSGGSLRDSVTLCDGIVVAAEKHRLAGFTPSGDLLWDDLMPAGGCDVELVSAEGGVAVVITDDEQTSVLILDPEHGARRTTVLLPGPTTRGASAGEGTVVYVPAKGDSAAIVHGIDVGTGSVREVARLPVGRSSLAVAGSRLVAGSWTLDEPGLLRRVDLLTGKWVDVLHEPVWSTATGTDVDIATARSWDRADQGSVIAMDAATGEVLWRAACLRALAAVDGDDVVALESKDEPGRVSVEKAQVVLYDAKSGSCRWRSDEFEPWEPFRVFLLSDAVCICDVEVLHFFDRRTGSALGQFAAEVSTNVVSTSIGLLTSIDGDITLLQPTLTN